MLDYLHVYMDYAQYMYFKLSDVCTVLMSIMLNNHKHILEKKSMHMTVWCGFLVHKGVPLSRLGLTSLTWIREYKGTPSNSSL